jgi:hypothetical protein
MNAHAHTHTRTHTHIHTYIHAHISPVVRCRFSACNVVYLNNVDVESLSGQLAVSKALTATFNSPDRLQATIVHFKVSNTGITLTDTKKK